MTGEELSAFSPSARRAVFLDQKMRRDLAASLRHIFQQASGRLAVNAAALENFLTRLEHHPVSPLAYSYYCDAVLAIEDNEAAKASQLLGELFQLLAQSASLTVSDLGDPVHDPVAQRIVRFIDTDPDVRFLVLPPSRAEAAQCRSLLDKAFALMDAGDPELAAEIRALIRQIFLAAGDAHPKALTFDGASSFMLFGGIILNANRSIGELGMVQMLAHESTHNLLFGLAADAPLVENSDEDLYPSPLRADPRPMEGIYHATFVTARMHRAVKKLIESNILSSALLAEARKDLADNARLFAGGIEVVNRFGKLSPLGASLMRGASDYMASA